MSRPHVARERGIRELRQTGILAILDTGVCPDIASLLQVSIKLSKAGIKFFQLRAKSLSDNEYLSVSMKLKQVLSGCILTINDRCDIAATAGVQGVHLGADDLSVKAARQILGNKGIVGVSAGNPTEVCSALKMDPDYISFGPAFSTSTKTDAGRALGAKGFTSLAALVPKGMPILAVGGITADNLDILIRAGADAVAVASWWWKQRDSERAGRLMLKAVSAARKK